MIKKQLFIILLASMVPMYSSAAEVNVSENSAAKNISGKSLALNKRMMRAKQQNHQHGKNNKKSSSKSDADGPYSNIPDLW